MAASTCYAAFTPRSLREQTAPISDFLHANALCRVSLFMRSRAAILAVDCRLPRRVRALNGCSRRSSGAGDGCIVAGDRGDQRAHRNCERRLLLVAAINRNACRFQFVALNDQLQPQMCAQYSPLVHEILSTAAATRSGAIAQRANRAADATKSSSGGARLTIHRRRQTTKEQERCADEFVERLASAAKNEWAQIGEIEQLDARLLAFASETADGKSKRRARVYRLQTPNLARARILEFSRLPTEHTRDHCLLNTDAVYLTTLASLSFALRCRSGDEPTRVSERRFAAADGGGALVYRPHSLRKFSASEVHLMNKKRR